MSGFDWPALMRVLFQRCLGAHWAPQAPGTVSAGVVPVHVPLVGPHGRPSELRSWASLAISLHLVLLFSVADLFRFTLTRPNRA